MDSDCVINIHGPFQNFSIKTRDLSATNLGEIGHTKLQLANFRVCSKEGDSFSAPHECEIHLIQHI